MLFDLQQELPVFAGDEGAGDAVGAHAAGAADAVDVFLGGFWYIVVDDVGNRGDVEAAGGDIGGDEAGEFAFAEFTQGLLAARLREIAVNGTGAEVFVFKTLATRSVWCLVLQNTTICSGFCVSIKCANTEVFLS